MATVEPAKIQEAVIKPGIVLPPPPEPPVEVVTLPPEIHKPTPSMPEMVKLPYPEPHLPTAEELRQAEIRTGIERKLTTAREKLTTAREKVEHAVTEAKRFSVEKERELSEWADSLTATSTELREREKEFDDIRRYRAPGSGMSFAQWLEFKEKGIETGQPIDVEKRYFEKYRAEYMPKAEKLIEDMKVHETEIEKYETESKKAIEQHGGFIKAYEKVREEYESIMKEYESIMKEYEKLAEPSVITMHELAAWEAGLGARPRLPALKYFTQEEAKHLMEWGISKLFPRGITEYERGRYAEVLLGLPVRPPPVKPAWAALEKWLPDVPILEEVAVGFVKGLEPIGKGIAEFVKGRPIPVAEVPYEPTLVKIIGEMAGVYGLTLGVAKPVGWVVKGVAKIPAAAFPKVLTGLERITGVPGAVPAAELGARLAVGAAKIARPVVYGFVGARMAVGAGEMLRAGVPPMEVARQIGVEAAAFAGFIRGFQFGIRGEPPIGIARVRVAEEPVYTGLRVGQYPIVGRTPEGWIIGGPKPTVAEALWVKHVKPSIIRGAVYEPLTKFETRFMAKHVFPYMPAREFKGIMESYRLTGTIRWVAVGVKKLGPIVKGRLTDVGVSEKGADVAFETMKKYSAKYKVFGSTAKEAQSIGIYRLPGKYALHYDIDIQFTKGGAKEMVDALEKGFARTDPGKIVIESPGPGTWKIKTVAGERLFDIHAVGTTYPYTAPREAWGMRLEMPPTKADVFRVATYGEEHTKEFASIAQLRKTTGDVVGFGPGERVKDIFRYLRSGYELSVEKWGLAEGAKRFAPVEKYWKGKLLEMGFTEKELARMGAEVAKEPTLLYAPPPTITPAPPPPIPVLISPPSPPPLPTITPPLISPPAYIPPPAPISPYLPYYPAKPYVLISPISPISLRPSPSAVPYLRPPTFPSPPKISPPGVPPISPPGVPPISPPYYKPPPLPSPPYYKPPTIPLSPYYYYKPPPPPPPPPTPPILKPEVEIEPWKIETKAAKFFRYKLFVHPLGELTRLIAGPVVRGKPAIPLIGKPRRRRK